MLLGLMNIKGIYIILVLVMLMKPKKNASSQFNYKKSRKCKELRRLLNEKSYKMKSILRINT